MFGLGTVAILNPLNLLGAVILDAVNLFRLERKQLVNRLTSVDQYSYLLSVVLSQPLQLLALVVLDVVQHCVDLPRLGGILVASVAVAAAVLTDQIDDAEMDEHPADTLED